MKKIVSMVLFLILAGCGNDTHPPQDQDEIYDPTPVYHSEEATAPYDYDKFRAILESSKLQYPEGKAVRNAGEFAGYQSEFFYCDTLSHLHFTVEKTKSMLKIRSELREIDEWKTSEPRIHSWRAELKTLKPEKGVDTYTWMQVHGSNDTYDFPLLRLAWVRNHEGKYDHLWAIIIINAPQEVDTGENSEPANDYSWVDLGERRSDFFTVSVDMGNDTMVISLDDKVLVYKDISYWGDVLNYFKGGVYMNRHEDVGTATAIFNRMDTYLENR